MKSFIHHLVESDKHYEKAEENKRSADSAKSQARPFDYHMHMADHHDNMSQWHSSKGRHGEADKHAQKSDEHHEKAMTVKEEVELSERREDDEYHNGPDPVKHTFVHTVSKEGGEKHQRTVTTGLTNRPKHEFEHLARQHLEKQGYKIHEEVVNELSTELLQRYKDKAMQSSADLSSKGKYKKSTDRLMAHMKATGKQIDKLKKEEVEHLDEAPNGHTIEAHGIKGTKGTPWRKTFKNHDHLNDWAEKNDSVEVHGTRDLEGVKKHVKEGLKPEHKMRPGWMLKADPELAKKVADNKKKYKSFKDTVGKKIETK